MSKLFTRLACPKATAQTLGAFLGEFRVMAVDGTVLDVPDSEANAKVFGYPSSPKGTRAAFPKVRVVLLIEAGTHLIVDALMCPYRIGERVRVLKLLRSVAPGMLLMWDRGLHSYSMINATVRRGSHYLGRVPANVKKLKVTKVLEDGSYLSWVAPDRKSQKKGATRIEVRIIEYTIEHHGETTTYRLITSLMDSVTFPALLLAEQYHQRWEIENTIDELKTHLLGRKTPIRSLKPREVQEIYGWLIGHYAVRSLMLQAATAHDISPLRLSFTGTLRAIRRSVPDFHFC